MSSSTHRLRPDRADASDAARLAHLLATRERELGTLTARLALTEEIERRRIAEGLHDEIGQGLAVIKVKLAELRCSAAGDDSDHALGQVLGLLDSVIRSIRSLTFSLSSPVLHQLGLAPAIENLLDRFASEHGLEVEFEALGARMALSEELGILLHRSVRELLHNVAKHAQARRVRIQVRRTPDRIEIALEDDGIGFDLAAHGDRLDPGGGFGLFSIRHGLSHVGGRIDLDSSPGSGTRVLLTVPLRGSRGGAA